MNAIQEVRVVIHPGTHIHDAAEQACHMALVLKRWVHFDFNGNELIAQPESVPKDIVNQWAVQREKHSGA
jgi:hypothetical protein